MNGGGLAERHPKSVTIGFEERCAVKPSRGLGPQITIRCPRCSAGVGGLKTSPTAIQLMTTTAKPAAPVGNGWLDFGAIALSGLCLVHCLAVPLLATLLPVFATGPLADERLHFWLLAAVVPTSFAAFGIGFHRHRRMDVVVLGLFGLMLVAAAAFGRHYGLIGEGGDRWITVCGGLVLSIAHIANYRLLHSGHRH
jgi:hypothetical protein